MPLKSWNDLLEDAGGAGNDFEPLPEGDYDMVVDECEAKQSKTGKNMYVAKCKVTDGPSKNRVVWHNFVIVPDNPNALSWFFRNMNIFGLDRNYFASNPSDHQVAEHLKGKRFRAQIILKQFNGQDRNEIKQFFTPRAQAAGPGGSPVPAAAAPQPAAPAPAPAPAFAAPPPAAAPPQAAPPAPAAPAPAPIQQEAATPPPAPAAPPVEVAPVAAPPAPPAPPAVSGGDTPPPPPPF